MMDRRVTNWSIHKGQVQDAPHARPGPSVGVASRKPWVVLVQQESTSRV